MKYSNLTEQKHGYPTTFSFTDLRPKLREQCFNVTPLDIAAHRAGENSLKGSLVLSFHISTVPYIGTVSRGLIMTQAPRNEG
ncbi:MAG: hypothetical protein WD397_03540 [Wenzhouxiangellaceae bacterium]